MRFITGTGSVKIGSEEFSGPFSLCDFLNSKLTLCVFSNDKMSSFNVSGATYLIHPSGKITVSSKKVSMEIRPSQVWRDATETALASPRSHDEADLRDFLFETLPASFNAKPVSIEFETDYGRPDILLKNEAGRFIIVETKKEKGGMSAVDQAMRYRDFLSKSGHSCITYVAGRSFSRKAKELAEENGVNVLDAISCLPVAKFFGTKK